MDLYLCSDQGGFALSSRSSLWTLEAGVCHVSLARLKSQIPRLCLDPFRLGHVLVCTGQDGNPLTTLGLLLGMLGSPV